MGPISNQRGFTLLELVMILMIIGILAVAVTPNKLDSPIRLRYEARRVLNDIRYVQLLSMTTGLRYRWVQTSTTSYQLVNQTGTAINLPSGGTTLTLASGVSFGTLTNLPSSLVAFDSFGVPYTTSSIPGTALTSAATIPLVSSSQTTTITITPPTGYGSVS